MIVELKLTYQGVTVTFAIHEVVEIARQLLPALDKEEIQVPNVTEYFDKLKKALEQFRESDRTPFDLLPIAAEIPMIPSVIRPGQWRYVADYIHSPSANMGYWLQINKRMLRVDKKNFYVSDYGIGFSGVNTACSLALSNRNIPLSAFKKAEEKYARLLEEEAESQSTSHSELVAPKPSEQEEEIFFLHLFSQILESVEKLEGSYDGKKKLETMSENSHRGMEMLRVLGESYRLKRQNSEAFDHLAVHLHENNHSNSLPPLPDFLNELAQKSDDHKKFSDMLGNTMVVMFNLMKIAKGDAEPIFRIDAFSSSSGAAYQQFEPELQKLLKKYTPSDIAVLIRKILFGDHEKDTPDCLPSLAAVWFIAEQSRDELAQLTNLIVLDFVEGNISYLEGGLNQYSWKSLLINSHTGERGTKLDDLYGFKLKPHEKGGMYPAEHDQSYNHSKNEKYDDNNHLKPNVPLSWLRQKQGHLILDWLRHIITHYCPLVTVEIVEKDTTKSMKIPGNKHDYSGVAKTEDNKNSTVAFEKNEKNTYHSKVALRKKEKDHSLKLSDYKRFWNKRLVPLRYSQTKLTLQLQLIELLLAARMNGFDFCFSQNFDAESVIQLSMGLGAKIAKGS